MTEREAIGEIKCPWCGRPAELHRSEAKAKLNPDEAKPAAAYPPKLFVICPPISGYRGCGTTLANSAQAQARMLENSRVFGASGKVSSKPPEPRAVPAAAPPAAPAPAAPPSSKKSIFDWM